MLTNDLPYFLLSEFKRPDLVDYRAARLLVKIRSRSGVKMIITDDGRPLGKLPPGASKQSLHFKGCAFDIRSRDWTREEYWKIVAATCSVAAELLPIESGVEMELVKGLKDTHFHIGFFFDGRPSRLILALE